MCMCVSTNICLYVCFFVMEFFCYYILYIFAFLIKISKSIHSTIDTTKTRENRNARKKEWIKHNLTFVWVASFWDGGECENDFVRFHFIISFSFLFFNRQNRFSQYQCLSSPFVCVLFSKYDGKVNWVNGTKRLAENFVECTLIEVLIRGGAKVISGRIHFSRTGFKNRTGVATV